MHSGSCDKGFLARQFLMWPKKHRWTAPQALLEDQTLHRGMHQMPRQAAATALHGREMWDALKIPPRSGNPTYGRKVWDVENGRRLQRKQDDPNLNTASTLEPGQ